MVRGKIKSADGVLFMTAVLFAGFFSLPALAGEDGKAPVGQKVIVDLPGAIARAVSASPEVGEARYDADVYRAKKIQADTAIYPKVEFLAIAAPSPEAHEEDYTRTDEKAGPIDGIFGSADLRVIQPLYTFGKISSYQEAAARALRAAEAAARSETSNIVLRTKMLYFGLLLGREMKNLGLEVKDQLDDAVEKAERLIEEGSPGADEVSLYKLRTFQGVLEKNLNEAEKGIALARDALMTTMQIPKETDFDIADTALVPETGRPLAVEDYVSRAKDQRPEFVQLREGLAARQALVEAEKSNYYPNIFFGIMGSIAGASNRDKIDNPYYYDTFNHATGAAFFGLQWNLDIGMTKGKVLEAEAEYHKLQEKKRFADDAIPLQVRKAYLDLQEANGNIQQMEMAYTNARKWLVTASANYDMGVGEAKDMADAAVAYATMKADYLRAIFNQRMAYASLLYASGAALQEKELSKEKP